MMDFIKDFLRPEIIWFLVGLVLLLLEFILPGLIIFFFGIGAFVVGTVCIFADISINAQLIIFIISSVVLLLILRNWVKSIFLGHSKAKADLRHDIEDFAGQKAVVKSKITRNTKGKVEFHGTDWEAESDETIEEGTTVEIINRDNLILKVKSI